MLGDWWLYHVSVTSISICIHLMEQSLILSSKAVVLSPDGVKVLDDLTQLALCLLIGFAVALQSLDVFRGYTSLAP